MDKNLVVAGVVVVLVVDIAVEIHHQYHKTVKHD
jgi:hypothetical protein